MNPEYPNMPIPASMQKGKSGMGIIISLIVFIVLFLASTGFGIWAFAERSDYKNNVDKKIETAVAKAVEESKLVQEKEFSEKEKSPYKEYRGPTKYGEVVIKYPKTWSVYVDETGDSNAPLSGYFNPNYVPGIQSEGVAYALRIDISEEEYDAILEKYDDDSNTGKVSVAPISAVNVANVSGVRIDGQIEENKRGSIVVFPLRDKTLILTVESENFINDFNEIILKNMSFTP